MTKPYKPSKPQNLRKAGQEDAYDDSYEVQWDHPSSGDYDQYIVQEKKEGGSDWCDPGNPFKQTGRVHGLCYAQLSLISTTSYPTNDREPGTYHYRVFACNAFECSDAFELNEELTVNVQPLPTPDFTWLEPDLTKPLRYQKEYTLTIGNNGSEGIEDGGVHFYRKVDDQEEELLDIPINYDSIEHRWKALWTASPLKKEGEVEFIELTVEMKNRWGVTTRKSYEVDIRENALPTVSIAELPDTIDVGETLTLTATATDSDGSIEWVKIFADSEVARLASPPYEYEWTPETAGDYTIFARAQDDEDATNESGQQIVTVNPQLPPGPPTEMWMIDPDTRDPIYAPFPANTTGSYTLSWAPVAGATAGYLVEECYLPPGTGATCAWDSEGSGYRSYEISGTSWRFPNQLDGDYWYRISACNNSEQHCGDPNTALRQRVVTSTPQAPTGLAASPVFDGFDITGNYKVVWDAVTSGILPDSYKLKEKAGGADSGEEWQQLPLNGLEPEFPVEDKAPGLYSYSLNACNPKGCTEAGEILTVNVLPPTLLSAEPDTACGENCLKVAGSGLDPASVFTLTDRESAEQWQPEEGDIAWTAPTQEDATTYAELSLPPEMLTALNEREGLHISVQNPNGTRASIDAYGDETVERLSQIDSAPAIGADGTIYVGSGDNVYALNPEDGSTISGWPFATGDLVKATPVVDSINGNIYVGSLDDNLYALSPFGLEQWRLQTGGDLVASAVLDENRILYQGSRDGVLYAVQAQNGAIQWTYPAGAGIVETPVLAGNGVLYFTTEGSSQVYALGRGNLGSDQLTWNSVDDSRLADMIQDENWQPSDAQQPQYLTAARLYRLLLQPPLPLSRDVLTFYTRALIEGAGPRELATAFLESDTGRVNFPSNLTNEGFVDKLYQRAFPGQGRPAFTYSGQTYTRNSLIDAMAGGISRAQVAVLFSQSNDYADATDTLLSRSFEYFYDQNYDWAVFDCEEGDEYTRDCDADGLPDHWEILFFGDIESESGDSDADGDGTSNLEAFLANQGPCANRCYGDIERAPDPEPMPALDMGQLALSSQIGSLPGNFSVNESGAATYSIPLSLPAGTAGVAPELSLNYSSQGGNGLLGHGWAIGGLSAISRCRQTLGQDKQAKPITWGNEDRFCLDGQRLIVVQGQYGADGSEYRTEIDSFALVKAHGGSAGHPDYFTVERKDGSIRYYGNGNNAKQATGQGTLTWTISRFEDSAGNPIEFIYKTADGHRISEVRYAYTGGTTAGASVHFEYEGRPDPTKGYLAGELVQTTQRLVGITVSNAVAGNLLPVHNYELQYLDDPRDRLSRLARIRQCADTICQPYTVFDWRLPLPGSFPASASDTVTLSTQRDRVSIGTRPADIDGDGRMDLVWLEPDWYEDGSGRIAFQTFKYVLADGGGFGEEQEALRDSANVRNPFRWEMFDYNGDGRADLAYYAKYDQQWRIVLSQPDANGIWHLNGTAMDLEGLTDEDIRFVDINADGFPDAVSATGFHLLVPNPEEEPTSSSFYHFSGEQSFEPEGLETWGEMDPELEFVHSYVDASTAGDFDGDGRVELILWNTKAAFVGTGLGGAFLELEEQHSRAYRMGIEGDKENGYKLVNRGKLLDFVQDAGDFKSKNREGGADPLDRHRDLKQKLHAMDINGDGLSDLIEQNGLEEGLPEERANYYYQLNTGQGFETPTGLGHMPENAQLQWFDYDNDGHLDLVWHEAIARRLKVKRWSTLDGAGAFREAGDFRTTSGNENTMHMFADMNGDGVVDYLRVGGDRAHLYPATDFRVPVNVIEKITNGMGAETDIAYGSLVNSGHYTRRDINTTTERRCQRAKYGDTYPEHGEPLYDLWCRDYEVDDLDDYYNYLNDAWDDEGQLGKISPTLELMTPMYLVTRVESSAPTPESIDPEGIDAKSSVSYFYAQAKIQAGGRGMLGFEQLRTIDEQTGVETATFYRQDFPYQGYPEQTKVKTADGKLLSQSTNTWKLKNADGEAWRDGETDEASWPKTAESQGSAALGPLQPWLAESVEETWELNSAVGDEALKTVTTTKEHDNHGNPTYIDVTTTARNGDSYSVETTNEYCIGGNPVDGNCGDTITFTGRDQSLSSYPELGRLTKTTVKHSRTEQTENTGDDGYDEETRTSAFTYYDDGSTKAGLLNTEIIEPDVQEGEENLRLTTLHDYDNFGNKIFVEQTAAGEAPRGSRWKYLNGDGRYLYQEINAHGQVTSEILERNELGLPTQVADIAGVITEITYDAFGRKVREYIHTGAHSITLLSAPSLTQCPEGSAYQRTAQTAGGGESFACLDVLGRETRGATRGFADGSWVYADTEYDKLGRVSRKSEPYYASAGGTDHWTTMDYDILGRVIGTDLPGIANNNGSGNQDHDIHIDYQGYTTVTTNPEGHTKTEIKNAMGELVSVRDQLEGRIKYRYDAQGNLRFVRNLGSSEDPHDLTIEMQYDKLGRKIWMMDPDKGGRFTNANGEEDPRHWEYRYNGFGDLIWQKDAKGQIVENTYDELGRQKTRTDYRTDGSLEEDTIWAYNDSPDWRKSEAGVDVPPGALEGVIEAESGYAKIPGYDRFGRSDFTLTIHEEVGEEYWQRTTYDGYGRPFQQFDAAGDGISRSATRNIYNNNGYLEAVVDAENINQASAENYYTIMAMDERGNVTEFRHGNGVVTKRQYDPATGRLLDQRASVGGVDAFEVQHLAYQWDNLGNLEIRWDYSGDKELEEHFEYDDLNRLTSAEVIGGADQDVTYDALGNIDSKSDVGDYLYGSDCDESYGPHAVCETSDGVAYTYDANGNMIGDSSGRSLIYSTFDKPLEITKDGHTTSFKYGPARSRYLRSDRDPSGQTTETRYIGNVEETRVDGTLVEVKRYLPGGALVRIKGGERESNYLYKDHLGSVDVITRISSGGGVQIEKDLSFDSWGQRRNAQDWAALIESAIKGFDTSVTIRGFTGHEMLDQVGLIHMNGRIYDARVARFLQADTFIDGATNTQGYNRYTYVHNNPLAAIDPSGHLSWGPGPISYALTGDFIGAATGHQLNRIIARDPMAAQLAVTVVGTVTGAFCGPCSIGFTALASADMGYYQTGGNWDVAVQQGIIAAYSAMLFYAAGTAAGDSYGLKVAYNGMAGGIMAEVQGGKFGHGFLSAGVTAAASPVINGMETKIGRSIVAGIVGGTASKVSGGKFANGAITGTFSQMFNDQLHDHFKTPEPLTVDDIFDADVGLGVSRGGISLDVEGGAPSMDLNALGEMIVPVSIDGSQIKLGKSLGLKNRAEIEAFGVLKTDGSVGVGGQAGFQGATVEAQVTANVFKPYEWFVKALSAAVVRSVETVDVRGE